VTSGNQNPPLNRRGVPKCKPGPKPGRLHSGQFKKGAPSANPAGKPRGSRHKATLAAEMLLDGETGSLTRKAIEMALAGDATAMRLCLERIIPPRKERPAKFQLPPLKTPADLIAASAAIVEGVASGELTAGEAADMSRLIANVGAAIEVSELSARLDALERAAANPRMDDDE
jgi:hypothetical protein